MPKMNIFEFLQMCYMSWEFWAGAIVGAMVGYAFCKLISLREIKAKNNELAHLRENENKLRDSYQQEIQALKKEINELKISNAFSEYYAGRERKA